MMQDTLDFCRRLTADHAPDGWPAVQMRQITALVDEIDRLKGELEILKSRDKLIQIKWDEMQQRAEADEKGLEECNKKIAEFVTKLSRYESGVEVESIAHSRGTSYAGMDCYVDVSLPMEFAGQRVRVLVMPIEKKPQHAPHCDTRKFSGRANKCSCGMKEDV